MFNLEWNKWWQTIKIGWSNYTTYRINFILMFIAPVLVFFLIKWNVWSSIFETSSETVINGYTFEKMAAYHFWILIINLLAQGHTAMNLSEDIRLGKISTYLIYPFDFWQFHTASFIAFQLLQIFISGISLAFGLWLFDLTPPSFEILLTGAFYCFFISLFWFSIQYFTGIIAFWLEETWILRVLFNNVAIFLSGSIIPLSFFPEWSVNILNYTPFPYMTYNAALIFMGEQVDIFKSIGILLIWTFIMVLLIKYVWNRGVRLYTAAGM